MAARRLIVFLSSLSLFMAANANLSASAEPVEQGGVSVAVEATQSSSARVDKAGIESTGDASALTAQSAPQCEWTQTGYFDGWRFGSFIVGDWDVTARIRCTGVAMDSLYVQIVETYQGGVVGVHSDSCSYCSDALSFRRHPCFGCTGQWGFYASFDMRLPIDYEWAEPLPAGCTVHPTDTRKMYCSLQWEPYIS